MTSLLDKMFLRVAKIQTYTGSRPLTNATGFFYLHDRFLYLVTSRHVVVNPATGHRPDRLQVSLHSDADDLRQRSDLSIPLYVEGVPQWHHHPTYGNNVDVVAVSINDPHVLQTHLMTAFDQQDHLTAHDAIPLGQHVLILGFPLGFHDTVHNLPIVRSATIASSFSHPFKGHPYFLTDARLHRGMSGSPVIVKLPDQPGIGCDCDQSWRLIGIHSSALDVSDRDPQQDERLGLNTAWYAHLIPDLLPRHGIVPS